MSGTVYFIQAGEGGPVKIGHTTRSVERRLSMLQTGNAVPLTVLRVCAAGRDEESAAHEHYKALRLRGEWFTYCPTMATVELAKLPRRAVRRVHRAKVALAKHPQSRPDWKDHMEAAITLAGGCDALAKATKLKPVTIRRLQSRAAWGQKNMSATSARKISEAVDGRVTKADLCPAAYGDMPAEPTV